MERGRGERITAHSDELFTSMLMNAYNSARRSLYKQAALCVSKCVHEFWVCAVRRLHSFCIYP